MGGCHNLDGSRLAPQRCFGRPKSEMGSRTDQKRRPRRVRLALYERTCVGRDGPVRECQHQTSGSYRTLAYPLDIVGRNARNIAGRDMRNSMVISTPPTLADNSTP